MGTGRMTATNTFAKGMLMDFDPLMSMEGGGMWTNALNGTLLTFNGNEKMMQPDMGNGRVETAYLPEGYVPLGTCEYGDIIYIVSYNPLENKCQLGCFPSPERNISSDEISDMQQSITIRDFQKIDSDGTPTGKLVGTSTKKILYDNENMYPGDKYIIYEESGTSNTDSDNLSANGNTLSDFGNTSHKHNKWPKLLKVNVVSIEDSGRITNMNTSIKWYTWQSLDYNDDGSIKKGTIYDPETDDYIEVNKTIDHDFYINRMHSESASGIDLDSYRDLISSPYSVYSSRISGKLALLIEVEEIDSFSCTFEVYTTACNSKGEEVESEEAEYTKYDVYFYTSWESGHNDINPIGFIFTGSNWVNLNSEGDNIKVGGVIGIPTKENSNTGDYYYDYKKGNDIEVPPISKNDIAEDGYNYDKVFQYSRTYKLEEPPETYDEYLKMNYDSKIDDICDWYKTEDGGSVIYKTIKNTNDQEKYGYLPVVSTIHREIDEGGRPKDYNTRTSISHEAAVYKYYYNLKVVELPDDLTGDPSYSDYEYYTIANNGYKVELDPVVLNDDVVNNCFKKDIPTLVASPIYQTSVIITNDDKTSTKISTDLSNLVWQYKVAPAMPYGVLEWLTLEGNIDFSKVGSGEITLTDWRYYNTTSQCTLTWGLECYPEPNKGIAEVVLDFYDNQGLACSMHIKGKSSYSGTFTETFDFGTRYSSYNMSSINADGDTFVHAGNAVDSPSVGSEYVFVGSTTSSRYLRLGKAYSGICTDINYTTSSSDQTKIQATINGDGGQQVTTTVSSAISRSPKGGAYGPYYDDSGTIYTSMLYAVKITVKYTTKNILGDYDDEVNQEEFKVFYRWLWTNSIFNDNYYSVRDFDVLKPQIGLDFTAQFDSFAHIDNNGKVVNNALSSDLKEYWDSSCNDHTEEGTYRSLGAVITTVGDQGRDITDVKDKDNIVGNILMSFSPSLQDTYNDSFTLAIPADYYDVTDPNKQDSPINKITYEEFKLDIIPGQAKIALNPEQPSVTNNAGSSVVSTSIIDSILMPQIIGNYEQTGELEYGYASKYKEEKVGNSLGPECQNIITGSDDNNSSYTTDEIWDSSTTYQNYKDCFSLTMIQSSSKKVQDTDDLHEYTDSLGTTYTLVGHNIYSTTMAAAYTQYTKESGDKSDYMGVQLNLQGYHFSKVCVGNWKPSTNASLLVSVLEAGLVPEIYADTQGNAYFIESATHVTCRSNECKTCTRDSKILKFDSSSETHNWYSSSSNAWTNMKRVNGYAEESKTSEITAEFNDFYPYLSSLITNANIFPIFFGGCETAKYWGTAYVRSDDDSSYTNIKEIFIGTNSDKGDGMHPFNRETGSIPYFSNDTFNNNVYRKATWYTVGIKTQSGGMIILPFFWLGALYGGSSSSGSGTSVWYPSSPKSDSLDASGNRNSQVFACKNQNRTCIDGDGSSSSVTARAWPQDLGSCRTFADVFASFFSQLYIVGGTSSDTYYNPEYEFYCSSYTESWSQDLVVHLYFEGDINNYLILHSMLLSDYIDQLYQNCDDNGLSTINTNNITIDVAQVCRVIEFQYNVTYSPNNLLSTIMAMNNVSEPQINVFGGKTVIANMEGSPSKNKFYVISSWADYDSGSVAVTNLKSTSTLYYVGGLYTNKYEGSEVVGVTGKNTINDWVNSVDGVNYSARKSKVPSGVVGTILNNISYDGDQIVYSFENPASYWTYFARWKEGWLKIKNIPSFNLTGDTLM